MALPPGQCWLLIYAGVVSFQAHPGTKERLTPKECCDLTDEYFVQFLRRMEAEPWLQFLEQLEPQLSAAESPSPDSRPPIPPTET